MKRSRALLAALVVLSVWIAGCSSGHPPNEKETKAAFIKPAHRILRRSRPEAGKDRPEG
jgi:hypothetical protein